MLIVKIFEILCFACLHNCYAHQDFSKQIISQNFIEISSNPNNTEVIEFETPLVQNHTRKNFETLTDNPEHKRENSTSFEKPTAQSISKLTQTPKYINQPNNTNVIKSRELNLLSLTTQINDDTNSETTFHLALINASALPRPRNKRSSSKHRRISASVKRHAHSTLPPVSKRNSQQAIRIGRNNKNSSSTVTNTTPLSVTPKHNITLEISREVVPKVSNGIITQAVKKETKRNKLHRKKHNKCKTDSPVSTELVQTDIGFLIENMRTMQSKGRTATTRNRWDATLTSYENATASVELVSLFENGELSTTTQIPELSSTVTENATEEISVIDIPLKNLFVENETKLNLEDMLEVTSIEAETATSVDNILVNFGTPCEVKEGDSCWYEREVGDTLTLTVNITSDLDDDTFDVTWRRMYDKYNKKRKVLIKIEPGG
ncbi:EGF-like domain-containing protein [Caerostris darwini]|uniref:EGF-like domain-containing protein n=1 Tax=Caerostris darwini TaxID=1538125 RepID=A0AAV4TD71_9ARAC|nr:EGF-like domain-containing protein [Caerostris darwini]